MSFLHLILARLIQTKVETRRSSNVFAWLERSSRRNPKQKRRAESAKLH